MSSSDSQLGLGLWGLVCSDLARAHEIPVPATRGGRARMVIATLPKAKSLATALFRVAHAVGRRQATAGALVKLANHVLTGADIDFRATIGPGLRIPHPSGVVVSGETVIGARCTIQTAATCGSDGPRSPMLGDDCVVGPGARLLGGVRLADRTYVAANAVVTRSCETPGQVLAGVPARILRERTATDRG